MSANSKDLVPYSRYAAYMSRGRVGFLSAVPIIGGFVFAWAANTALDELWSAQKKKWEPKKPDEPDYQRQLKETQDLLRQERERNRDADRALSEAQAQVKRYEDEQNRTIFKITWPKQ